MKFSKANWVVATCLALMVGTAGLLRRLQSNHRLGNPGLKLENQELVDETGKTATTNRIFLPERVLDYGSQLQPIRREELNWLPHDTTFGRRLYSAADGFQVLISCVLMGVDRTSIHKPEYCLPSQGFHILRRLQKKVAIDRPRPYQLPVTRLDAEWELRRPNGGTERTGAIYVYWFLSDSRLSNDHLERMWWLAVDLVRTGELQRWAYVGCLGTCVAGEQEKAYARMEHFIQSIVPEFQLTTGPLSGLAVPGGKEQVAGGPGLKDHSVEIQDVEKPEPGSGTVPGRTLAGPGSRGFSSAKPNY